ncbi:MAG: thioredoxin domain-containing protein [Candidatus Peregrinibacteria bacterium]
MKRTILWISVALAIWISIFVIIKIVSSPTEYGDIKPIQKSDHTLGSGPIELIEYSDYQCPACAGFHYMVKDILAEFGNYITFAYRHFPLKTIHPNSTLASQAAEAAGYQGKFFEMSDLLFINQKEWGYQSESDIRKTFTTYASTLGLDLEKFLNDMTAKDTESTVSTSYNKAMQAGLSSTPSFFLNGKKVQNPRTPDEFRALIRTAINENTQ